jgi:DNA-binding NtrC family response regulator
MDKTFQWAGDSIEPIARVLAQEGWTLDETSPSVVVSTEDQVSNPKARRTVWLVRRTLDVEALKQALRLGVYAVVVTEESKAHQTLLERMNELVVVDAPIQPPDGFVAHSAASQSYLRQLYRAAQTSMPVLLTGETGTGKDVGAKLIHGWSSRKGKQLVPINCAAIPNELMEAELFGYVKGSFSGATRDYDGLVSAAEGGTVFLDEVDDTPHSLQVKLLRVLEDRVVSRLGESRWREVNFRIVAATNRQLETLIEAGQFGADLYQRLATLRIEAPPLRQRKEDILPLTHTLLTAHYVDDAVTKQRHHVVHVSSDAQALLEAYSWPGNIRELRNAVATALVAKRLGDTLLASDLPRRLWEKQASKSSKTEQLVSEKMAAGAFNLKAELEAFERTALTLALRQSNGNATEAARALGEVGRGSAKNPGDTVRAMMKRLGV